MLPTIGYGSDPVVRFTQLVRALLSQMKASTDSSWEIQLLLREIQRPTPHL